MSENILIITIAGLSSRFSKSVGHPCVKCLYYQNSFEESLLYRMLQRHKYFDRIILVGGYEYDLLKSTVEEKFKDILDKIELVQNEEYATYGSGYSLYKGYEDIKDEDFKSLIFAEGDLFLDDVSFEKVVNSEKSVMTYNHQTIESDKSVAFYIAADGKPHYIYDTAHSLLEINEPFKAIYNSGQVWKFTKPERLREVYKRLTDAELQGTNLVPVNGYFQSLEDTDYELIGFNTWINCNTVADFNGSLEKEVK